MPVPTMPRSREARQVARALVKDPASVQTVAQWAAPVQVGERTQRRVFVVETGLTFAAWRREIRLDAALPLPRDPEMSVARVAAAVGVGTSTGFIRRFRTRFGLTPTAWRGSQDAADAPGGCDGSVVARQAWVPGQVVASEVSGSWTSVEGAMVGDALLASLRVRRTPVQRAESGGLTVRTLNVQFREATGKAPSTVAHAVGYRHLSQFSRDFAARYGVEPRKFMRK